MERGLLRAALVAAAILAPVACVTPHPAPATPAVSSLDRVAESYVRSVLALGLHDADYVDAYYGPAEWKAAVEAEKPSVATTRERAAALVRELEGMPAPGDEMLRLRHAYLLTQLRAVVARADMLGGRKMTFDEESKALYDAVAPRHDESHYRAILARLEPLLPGEGTVSERYPKWRAGFAIPKERLDAVFARSIEACRGRTVRHLTLPAGESFRVEYVTDKPWSGYNWYQGNAKSLIQVNTSLPIYVDRAIDLACHEGYPGHHVYNALLEEHLVKRRGWRELTVYPLFSPQSLIAEGSANFGIEMAFPGRERVAFERDSIWGLAGLDPARADEYYRVQELVRELSYAGNEAARRWLDGEIDRAKALEWLTTYALYAPAAAEQRLRFIERYRSYVINYNLGQDLVRRHVERVAGPGASAARRWEVFGALLSSPRLPSGL